MRRVRTSIPLWWIVTCFAIICGGLLARAQPDEDSSSWRTVSSSGKRYHGVHNSSLEETDKSVHNVPIATNYYPSRKEPSAGEPGDPVVHNPAQPTRYHYYPHNQHVYLLPECAIQQVCNAVYVRLNFTQPLCACPLGHRDPCSASLRTDDLHTTELVTDPRGKALTLVKTCEPVSEMRECRAPRDWSLLALQNVRTGKSHYLVICRCPSDNALEGPMSHDQPTYASVPGIRVFGMMCVRQTVTKFRSSRPLRMTREAPILGTRPLFPWHRARQFARSLGWTDRTD